MKNQQPSKLIDVCRQIKAKIVPLVNKPGVHTASYMVAAGFRYTGNGDTARCKDCRLAVSNWTLDMNPFDIHSARSPRCSFIRRLMPFSVSKVPSSSSSSTTACRKRLAPDELEAPKRRKIELTNPTSLSNILPEPYSFQQCRNDSFFRWSHNGSLSQVRMSEAGFSNCNVGDRVICINCNLICQQWTPHKDVPYDVHKKLSPQCSYVQQKLPLCEPPLASVINDIVGSMGTNGISHVRPSNNTNSVPFSSDAVPVVRKKIKHRNVLRPGTFATACPTDGSLSITEMIREDTTHAAEQFNANNFCCDDYFDHWDSDDNPKTEDYRWFLQWLDGRQLCGDELFNNIQETNRAQQRRTSWRRVILKTCPGLIKYMNLTSNSRQSLMADERILSIMIRCWESKVEGKHDRSICYRDLVIVRCIQQKQLVFAKNIIILSKKMEQICEEVKQRYQEVTVHRQAPKQFCAICLEEERRLAFVPCGHLVTCVPCGHSVRSCPTCREVVKGSITIHA